MQSRTHWECLHFSSLSLFSSPAVIDVLFHSAQHKLRRHGYSCRDVLSPGDGQYWNNNSLNNTTTPSLILPSILYCTQPPVCRVWCSLPCKGSWQCYKQPGRCVCSASPGSWLCPGPALVFLLEKPLRRGREPCGSRTRGSGSLLALNKQLQKQNKLLWLVSYRAGISISGVGITPQHDLKFRAIKKNLTWDGNKKLKWGIESLVKSAGEILSLGSLVPIFEPRKARVDWNGHIPGLCTSSGATARRWA